MTNSEAVEILKREWKRLVGDYRYQNSKKLDYEEALDKAIFALDISNPKNVKYSMMRQLCPECDCDLRRWYSYCPDCGTHLNWDTDRGIEHDLQDEPCIQEELSSENLEDILTWLGDQ